MSLVFISYRHDDCPYAAHLIWDKLAARLGVPAVFIDDQRVAGGEYWDASINSHLDIAFVIIAVIGKRWLTQLTKRQKAGKRDYVREELERAIRSNKTILPVLVEGVGVPDEHTIPESIRAVFQSQAVTLSPSTSFSRDTQDLIDRVISLVGDEPKPSMVSLPAGTFTMGSNRKNAGWDEKPQFKVEISRPFRMSKTPITISHFNSLPGIESVSWPFADEEHYPAHNISWEAAVRFCNQLSEVRGLPPYYDFDGELPRIPNPSGEGYRLPTEAEWEYACRANTTTLRYFRNSPIREYAHIGDNSPQRVGHLRSNDFKLCDMNGNVWEWVWDAYDERWYQLICAIKNGPVRDPRNDDGFHRVVRGGSFRSSAKEIGSTIRRSMYYTAEEDDVGFRIVQSCLC